MLVALFFLGSVSAVSVTLNYTPYYNWVDAEQGTAIKAADNASLTIGYLYWEKYSTTGLVFSNMQWVAPWGWCYEAGCGNPGWRKMGAFILRDQPYSASNYIGSITFRANMDSTNLTTNFSIANAYVGAQDFTLYLRKYWSNNTLKDTIRSFRINNGSNAVFGPFTNTSINISAGEYIRLIIDSMGGDSGDIAEVYNYTITGTGTNSTALNQINISVFDELNPTIQKQFNLTISNSSGNTESYFVNYSTAPKFNKTVSELPATGIITLTMRNNTCLTGNVIPRQLILDTESSNLTVNSYLLCDGATIVPQTFLIVDATSGLSISNALVSLQKNFNSQYVNLSSSLSSGGSVSFYMDFTSTYQIIADAPGYFHFAAAWNPSQSTTNRLAMVSSNSTTLFNYSMAGLFYSYGPGLVKMANNVMWFNMSSSDGQLTQYGMDLIAANSTFTGTINQTNASNVYGSNVTVESDFRIGNYTNVSAVLWWIKAGFPRFNTTIVYYPQNATNQNASLTDAIDQFNQNPPGKTFTGLMAIIITAPVAAWATRYGGPSTGGIVAIGVLALFTFFGNWLPWMAWGLIVLFVATTLYFIRGRG